MPATPPRPQRWLLLDRDDTILDDPGYLSDPEAIRFLPGALEGLAAFRRAGWPLVVISNQSGIGRGLFSMASLEAVHLRFLQDLRDHDVVLAGLFFCPHGPDDGCGCRKPEPGMAHQASLELGLELEHAVMVGDKESDLEMGRRIGAAYVAQIAARGQQPLLADGCFGSIWELSQALLTESAETPG